jgi:hypothetical protein
VTGTSLSHVPAARRAVRLGDRAAGVTAHGHVLARPQTHTGSLTRSVKYKSLRYHGGPARGRDSDS